MSQRKAEAHLLSIHCQYKINSGQHCEIPDSELPGWGT